ncbi:MAG TPA: hypothetical protein DD391_05465 [Clostridiales bacterium]|jgi:hypothetical protein|nr:hypothetical protein [Clostridiales bacterium]HBL82036.1 hypothetical protein [Clostridiales bacterium]
MDRESMLNAAKLRLRKTKSDALDEDIWQLIQVAVTDLGRIGVSDKFLEDCEDPLLCEAVLTFVNANYGNNPDREKLMAAYDMMLTKIKGGKYFNV